MAPAPLADPGRHWSATLLGSWLLLHLPEAVFEKVVPVLLVLALSLWWSVRESRSGRGRRAELSGQSRNT